MAEALNKKKKAMRGSVVEVSYTEAVQSSDGETVFAAEYIWPFEMDVITISDK